MKRLVPFFRRPSGKFGADRVVGILVVVLIILSPAVLEPDQDGNIVDQAIDLPPDVLLADGSPRQHLERPRPHFRQTNAPDIVRDDPPACGGGGEGTRS